MCFLFLRKKKERFLSKRNLKKKLIVRIILSFLIIGLLFIPYEAPFVRFDSAETSIKYSTLKGNLPLHVIEGENTIFTLQNANNNFYFHSIIKYDEKYGFCDYKSEKEIVLESTFIEDDYIVGTITAQKLLNYETNETCYCIIFSKIKSMEQNEINLFDTYNLQIKTIFKNDKNIVFAFIPNQDNNNTAFSYNGQTFSLN